MLLSVLRKVLFSRSLLHQLRFWRKQRFAKQICQVTFLYLSPRVPLTNFLLRIISIDVFLKGHFLVYVIRLPLINNVFYNLYHVLLLPIKINSCILPQVRRLNSVVYEARTDEY